VVVWTRRIGRSSYLIRHLSMSSVRPRAADLARGRIDRGSRGWVVNIARSS
jgi:hypothetical protein